MLELLDAFRIRAAGHPLPLTVAVAAVLFLLARLSARRPRPARLLAWSAAAGVAVTTVRYDGITHDFMMLNPLSDTHAARAAVAQAISVLRGAFYGT